MMAWVKRIGVAIAAALTAYLAFRAAQRVTGYKETAKKWQEVAVGEAQTVLADAATRANQAFSQAKLAEAKANEAEKKALELHSKQVKRDESMESIADRWQRDGGMRDSTAD